jgi:hypothetical protein
MLTRFVFSGRDPEYAKLCALHFAQASGRTSTFRRVLPFYQ